MRKLFFILIFIFLMSLFPSNKAYSYSYDLVVLPVDILNSCDNYYCLPAVSNIVAEDVIKKLNNIDGVSVKNLYDIRKKLNSDTNLRNLTISLLNQYKITNRVNFEKIKKISDGFDVKSVLLVDAYSNTEKTPALHRNLWEILEISSAFDISYPFNLVVESVLTDSVNNIIMWSAKFNKTVSNTNGYFVADNYEQALSQLEKIKMYSKSNISENISQNIYLRFFPREMRSDSLNLNKGEESNQPKFMPNALDNLTPSKILEELEKEKSRSYDNPNDFIFQF